MKRKQYDQQLIRWVKNHYWDSLEKDKDLILRHLRTFANNVESSPICPVCKKELNPVIIERCSGRAEDCFWECECRPMDWNFGMEGFKPIQHRCE